MKQNSRVKQTIYVFRYHGVVIRKMIAPTAQTK